MRKPAPALASASRLRDPVPEAGDAGRLGAVRAAIEDSVILEPVANDPAAAVSAGRCKYLDRALEAVKNVVLATLADRERLVVVVAA